MALGKWLSTTQAAAGDCSTLRCPTTFSSSHPLRHAKFLSHQNKPAVRTLVTSTGSMRSLRTEQLLVMTPNTVTPELQVAPPPGSGASLAATAGEIAVLNSLKASGTSPKNLVSSILTSCRSGFFLPRIPPFRFHHESPNMSQATQHGLRNLATDASPPYDLHLLEV